MADASLHQALGQQQSLTPQMRRSLEILQTNALELEHMIQQAMELNPVLEMAEEEPQERDADDDDRDDYDEDGLEYLNDTDDEWRERAIQERGSASADDEERRQFLYDSIVAPQTLQQFLAEQVHQSIKPEEIKEITLALIGNLNERGFHDEAPEKLAAQLGVKLSWMAQAVKLLQSFDPAGVGAADLRESLLLQLDRQGRAKSLEYKIVAHHLEELARRHITQIAKALGTSVERVGEAAERIAALDPDPGGSFSPSSNPHITPDVVIRRNDDGEYEAELTNDHIPRLRISDFYKSLLAKTGSDKKTLEYLRENIRDGRSLIGSISLRQETIFAIAQEIIKRQQDFLRHGVAKLRPMTMVEIAEALGMHATTISRAVAGKYVLTPHGMREMRAFFATGYQTSGGGEVSNAAVREAMQALIAAENPAKPLSDEALMNELLKSGIEIKRRTVAKYRDQMHILPTHLRKR